MERHIPVVQGTKAWHDLRNEKSFLRASEVGSLVGVNDHVTQKCAKQVYNNRQKGICSAETQNEKYAFHMQRGIRMEPIIFAKLKEYFNGLFLKVGAFVKTEDVIDERPLTFLASPDCICVDSDLNLYLLEIKNPMNVKKHMEKYGGVCPVYLVQIMIQMFTTGIKTGIISLCEGDGEAGHMVNVSVEWNDSVWVMICIWIDQALQEAESGLFQNMNASEKKYRIALLQSLVIKTQEHQISSLFPCHYRVFSSSECQLQPTS